MTRSTSQLNIVVRFIKGGANISMVKGENQGIIRLALCEIGIKHFVKGFKDENSAIYMEGADIAEDIYRSILGIQFRLD